MSLKNVDIDSALPRSPERRIEAARRGGLNCGVAGS
jgi:hypothetical protein